MFGRLEGTRRERSGAMHVFDAATRFYGGNAIVGGGLPLAGGLALADVLQHCERVTACFFGEGGRRGRRRFPRNPRPVAPVGPSGAVLL